jgi:hypothetical protein
MNEKPFCKRCMLDGMIENSSSQIEQYVGSLSDEIKAGREEYERRLKLCENCKQLSGGVCRLCGCFVMARAAKKQMGCPSNPPKWECER